MGKYLQVTAITALLAATSINSLAPEPEPVPEPPAFADNMQERICEQVCEWVGDQWICWTVCY